MTNTNYTTPLNAIIQTANSVENISNLVGATLIHSIKTAVANLDGGEFTVEVYNNDGETFATASGTTTEDVNSIRTQLTEEKVTPMTAEEKAAVVKAAFNAAKAGTPTDVVVNNKVVATLSKSIRHGVKLTVTGSNNSTQGANLNACIVAISNL